VIEFNLNQSKVNQRKIKNKTCLKACICPLNSGDGSDEEHKTALCVFKPFKLLCHQKTDEGVPRVSQFPSKITGS
jgi:hypothetical protein